MEQNTELMHKIPSIQNVELFHVIRALWAMEVVSNSEITLHQLLAALVLMEGYGRVTFP